MPDALNPPPLAELRAEIDRIDEEMHRLLMQRGEIIGRLISVKRTEESGSAFRPAREADMMRRLVERHRGILPLDTAESILRVIIATFTFVQAPFRVHADLSAGEAAMRDTERFHFGFTVPLVPHMGAAGVLAEVASRRATSASSRRSRRRARGGPRSKATPRRKSSPACRSSSAPTTRPGCRCSRSRGRIPTRSSATSPCGA